MPASGAASRCRRRATDAGLPLDGFFALNAAMPALHALYQKREALIVHAVHSPYRGRSHFDGQDVLESGLPGVAPDRGRLAQPRTRATALGGQGQPARARDRRRGAAC